MLFGENGQPVGIDGDDALHVHLRRLNGLLEDDVVREVAEQNRGGMDEQRILDLYSVNLMRFG